MQSPKLTAVLLALTLGLAGVAASEGPARGTLFVQCSVHDADRSKIHRTPVFEVDEAAYDADVKKWRRSTYSAALLARVKSAAAGRTLLHGCYSDRRVSDVPLAELSEPYSSADDPGFESVAAFAESDEPGRFTDAFGTTPAVEQIAWSPQEAEMDAARQAALRKAASASAGDPRLSGYIFCRYDVRRNRVSRTYFSAVMPQPARLKDPKPYLTYDEDTDYPLRGIVYDWFESHLRSKVIDTDEWTVERDQWATNTQAKPAARYCWTASNRAEAEEELADLQAIAKRKRVETISTGWSLSEEDYGVILAKAD